MKMGIYTQSEKTKFGHQNNLAYSWGLFFFLTSWSLLYMLHISRSYCSSIKILHTTGVKERGGWFHAPLFIWGGGTVGTILESDFFFSSLVGLHLDETQSERHVRVASLFFPLLPPLKDGPPLQPSLSLSPPRKSFSTSPPTSAAYQDRRERERISRSEHLEEKEERGRKLKTPSA